MISGERLHEGPDEGLEDFATTEPDPNAATSAGTSVRAPLWPFAVGLVVAGAALGFAVLRAPAEPKAEPGIGVHRADPAAALPAPSAVAPVVSEVPLALPPPSAAASSSAMPPASVKPGVKAPKPPPPGSKARIPTDLENPF